MNRMHSLERVENTHTEGLEARGFRVYRGWNDAVAAQLVELSRQPHILDDTPNDAAVRFKDVPSAHMWHDQGNRPTRSVYTLQTDEVTGLIWYDVRPRSDIDANYTFAIRMYEASQGRKLAGGFMRAAHHDFADRKANPSVWLDVANNNPRARRLYDNFGYQPTHQEGDRTVMVYRGDE